MKYGSRLAAAMLPCLAFAIVWFVAISPILDAFDQLHARRDGLIALVAAEQRDIAATPALRAAYLSQQSRQAGMTGLRREPSEALAQAGLQNDLQEIVASVGGQTESIEPLPSAMQSGYQAISVQATILFPASALGDLLRMVEERQPYIFITAASLQSPDAQLGDANGASPENLTLICTIAAYRRP